LPTPEEPTTTILKLAEGCVRIEWQNDWKPFNQQGDSEAADFE
jgi:hypothetical protein